MVDLTLACTLPGHLFEVTLIGYLVAGLPYMALKIGEYLIRYNYEGRLKLIREALKRDSEEEPRKMMVM